MAAALKVLEGVIDTHVHLTFPDSCINAWVDGEGWDISKYTEETLVARIDESIISVKSAVYVQCFNHPPLEEACTAIALARSSDSIIKAVVAEIPVPMGAEKTSAFLAAIRKRHDGKLPNPLKGGRVVLLGNPAPDPKTCLSKHYQEGLQILQQESLHWEFCCTPKHLPAIFTCCENFPKMTFIIDHLGHNGGSDDDYSSWSESMAKLAKLPNVSCKLGAIEEWGVSDPLKFMNFAIASFGFERVMYESNWFVLEVLEGCKYDKTAKVVLDALCSQNATQEDMNAVFFGNAERIYRLK